MLTSSCGKGLFDLFPLEPSPPEWRDQGAAKEERERKLKEAEKEWLDRRREAARRAERFREALLQASRAEREALAKVAGEKVEAAGREALSSEAFVGHRATAASRGIALTGMPTRVGSAATEPLLFCQRCGFVLSRAFACRCDAPDPAILVPPAALELPDEKKRTCLDHAWWKAWAEVAIKTPLDRFPLPKGFREARVINLES